MPDVWARCTTSDPGGPPTTLVLLTTRDDYTEYFVDDRRNFELSILYDEFARSRDQRRLPMSYEPRDEAVSVYRQWRQWQQSNASAGSSADDAAHVGRHVIGAHRRHRDTRFAGLDHLRVADEQRDTLRALGAVEDQVAG